MNFWSVSSSGNALHFQSAVEVITAGIVGDGDPVAGGRVQPADGAAVVLAVCLDIIGAAVHILGAAIHLAPEGDFILLGALGGAVAVMVMTPLGAVK